MNFGQIKHSLEGALRSTSQLKKFNSERNDKQVSLPTPAQMVRKIENIEKAMYDLHAQSAKWNMSIIEEIENG